MSEAKSFILQTVAEVGVPIVASGRWMRDMGWTSRRVGKALGHDVGCLGKSTHYDVVGYMGDPFAADAAFGVGGTKQGENA